MYEPSFFETVHIIHLFLGIFKSENRANNGRVYDDSFLPFLSEKLLLWFKIFINNWVRYPVIGLPHDWVDFKLTRTWSVFTLTIMVLLSCEEETLKEHI